MNKHKRALIIFWHKTKDFFRNLIQTIKDLQPRFKQGSKYIIYFIKAFYKKFGEESILSRSASLTYVTILGFVPFIIFLLFFLPELPFLNLQEHFKDIIIKTFVPDSANQIYEYISQMANQKISFNFFSFIILLVTSYSLFNIINTTFDKILNVHEKKKTTIFQNLIKFFGMTIFGSLLILLLLSATSLPLVSKITDLPILQGLSLYVTPFILLFIIFLLGFNFIPSIKIDNRSVLLGAALSAAIWILFKSFFNWYIINLTNTKLIFGVLASVPIFLFWIYFNWIIILSGVIIVSILEKRHIKEIPPEQEKTKIRITFEKYIDKDKLNDISTTMNEKDLKDILKELALFQDKKKS